MSKPTIRIHNTETNEIIDREMTDDEFEQHQEYQLYLAKEEADNKLRAEQKSALLERLGITADEAKLLLS